MDLYQKLNNSDELIDQFCDILEDLISKKVNYNVNIGFKKHDLSIFFFIDGSSILQIMPDKDLQYPGDERAYAHVPSYQDEIKNSISQFKTQYERDIKIEQIIKKGS
jgi:hypothetical protein